MSNTIKVRGDASTSSSNAKLFYETSSAGVFDGEITPSGTTIYTATSELDSFRIVAVPIGTSNRRKKVLWSDYSSYYVSNTDYGMLTHIRNGTSNNEFSATDYSSDVDLDIVDAHGTHSGTVGGSYYTRNQFLATKHETTSGEYTYSGVRITFSSSSSGNVISSGGTTSGLITEFPASYSSAIIIQCGTSGKITVEYIYSEPVITRTVSLDANGGTVSPSSVSCTGTYANAVAIIPTWAQHQFLGWFDAASGGNEITAITELTQSSPSTLYAHWEEIPVGTWAINYILNGGTGGPSSTTVEQGSSYTIPSDIPTKTDYTFDGWLVGSDTEIRQPGYTFTPSSDTNISAQWSGGPTPPTPRPEEEKGMITRSSASEYLIFSISGGMLVYAT